MKHLKNEEIARFTTLKIGGPANNTYFPENLSEFEDLLRTVRNPLILGNGSNVLVSSNGVDADVIFTTALCGMSVDFDTVTFDCGVKCAKASLFAEQNSLAGLEFLAGIPGTIGGVVFMNASAHGQSVSDIFEECSVFDLSTGKNLVLKREEMDFGYRHTVLETKPYIVLNATFRLKRGDGAEIHSLIKKNLEFRKQCQPSLLFPNAGSTFKNPEFDSAGRLLDKTGMKAKKIGSAKVWENHANFIVNTGGATSLDVSELMYLMKKSVLDKYTINLTPEVRYIGSPDEREKEIWEFLKK
ncbi:MAG: UDP-N-acetylmuramate dehydrogenase [Candidatus Gastranaerophilaceae bacterium]